MLEVDYDASGIPRVEFGENNLQRLLLVKQKQDLGYKLKKNQSSQSINFELESDTNNKPFAAKIEILNVDSFDANAGTFVSIDNKSYTGTFPSLGTISDYQPSFRPGHDSTYGTGYHAEPDVNGDDQGIYDRNEMRFAPDSRKEHDPAIAPLEPW